MGPGEDTPRLSLGLDIGGTNITGLVIDGDDRVCASVTLPTRHGEQGLRESVAAVADAVASAVGTTPATFATVGVGLPGIVDQASGDVSHAVNLGIDQTNIPALLADVFTAPVVAENDVKATALGIAHVMDDVSDLTYLNIGTGVAVAVIVGGRLVRGVSNGAGEIGHFSVDAQGEWCACGQRGCLETVAGGRGLWKRLAAIGADIETLDSDTRPEAVHERETFIDALCQVAALIAVAYDPAVIALGGGVVHAAWIHPALVASLRERATGSPLLTSLAIADRLRGVPDEVPAGALGAAIVGRCSWSGA